jgi:hypothetical protein
MTLEAARGFLAAKPQKTRPAVSPERITADALLTFAQAVATRILGKQAASMEHLRPLAEQLIEMLRAVLGEREPVKFVAHAAVQHGKSTLLQAFVLFALRLCPWLRIGYASYAADIAQDKMWVCRDLAESFGVRLRPEAQRRDKWLVLGGGYVQAHGLIGGQWTGGGFEIILMDDLYKGPEEADSGAHRRKLEAAFDSQIETRGAERLNLGCVMARWHPRDLSGVLTGRGWLYICLAALGPGDIALAPAFMSLRKLLELRDGGTDAEGKRVEPMPRRWWFALYQGRPQVDGAKIFDPAHLVTYDRLPEGSWVEGLGIDAAYGARARHNRSAIVPWRRYIHEPRVLYLGADDVWLGHEVLELFACRVAEVQIRRAGGPRLRPPKSVAEIETKWREQLNQENVRRARRLPARWYGSSSEVGAAGLFTGFGGLVKGLLASVDKLARGQGAHVSPMVGGFTSAWSEGRLRWPAVESEHVAMLRAQCEDFTGAGDEDDDGVDAAVAGHDEIAVPAGRGDRASVRAAGSFGYSGAREA